MSCFVDVSMCQCMITTQAAEPVRYALLYRVPFQGESTPPTQGKRGADESGRGRKDGLRYKLRSCIRVGDPAEAKKLSQYCSCWLEIEVYRGRYALSGLVMVGGKLHWRLALVG